MILRRRPSKKNTKRGREVRAIWVKALSDYGIDESRVDYKKCKYNYRGECAETYENFLSRYTVESDTLFLHDGGNAFKKQKVSIFDSLGFKSHVQYPSDVHQYLSPNDNKLHGCKSTWYREYSKFQHDVEAPLRLMQLIDLDIEKNSKKYFLENIIECKKSDVDQIIRT